MVHNELVLSGWAVSPQGVSQVAVEIDGRVFNATYGLDTPWAEESMPDTYAARTQAGFHLSVDTSTWSSGRRELRIVAFDGEDRGGELVGEVDVRPFAPPKYTVEDNLAAIAAGDVVMWLESPVLVVGPCREEAPVELIGWAYARDGIEKVVATVDGRATYEALRPISRPYLLGDYGPEVAGKGGFVIHLDPAECPPGVHRVAVVAIGRNGQAVGVENELTCLPAEEEEPPPAAGEATPVGWSGRRKAPPRRRRDEAPERYDPEEHAGLVFEAEHQLRYRWATTIAQGKRVLDAGCGVGWGSLLLLAGGAESVVGADISEDALAEARRRAGGTALELQQADLQALPFADASFDLVTCFEAIEHVPDPDLALDEFRRVLRPDGVLLISTPRRRPSLRDNPHHLREFTPSEFEAALSRRFANVRVHRQRTCLASALFDDDGNAIGDPATDLGIDVRKLDEGRPGGEAYSVAVAGDGDLPDLSRMAMLAAPDAVYQLHESAFSWEDRALIAEAEAAARRNEANLAQLHQQGALRVIREKDDRLHELAAQLLESERAIDALRREAESASERIAAAQSDLERARTVVAALESSASWRVTRPLRAFKALGRRRRASNATSSTN